jgi:PAS domain S-box-containing protein
MAGDHADRPSSGAFEPPRPELGSGAILVRQMVPWAVGVPLFTFGLAWLAIRAGYISPAAGAILQTLTDILVLAAVLLILTRRFDATADAIRASAEATHQRLAAIVVEAAPIAMLMADRGGKIVLVNEKMEELFGYRRDELVGQPLELLVPEHLHPSRLGEDTDNPEAGPAPAGREPYGRHKNGAEIPVEIGLNYLNHSQGLYAIAAIVDITERKHARDELRRSNAELEQFAYVASHDLQEPLRMVASYTELLAQRYRGKLDDKADKYIHYAVDGAKRMQRLVSDLLAFSRVGLQGKKFAPVDSGRVLQYVLEVLRRPIAEAGAMVEAGRLPLVLADETQLQQLFQNLVGNALKFRRAEQPSRIAIRARELLHFWEFTVEDNGIGIEPQYTGRIFQMFQRLHSRGDYEGNGIGLAISKKIVERHGGIIRVESTFGEATLFHFTLPKVKAETNEPSRGAP